MRNLCTAPAGVVWAHPIRTAVLNLAGIVYVCSHAPVIVCLRTSFLVPEVWLHVCCMVSTMRSNDKQHDARRSASYRDVRM